MHAALVKKLPGDCAVGLFFNKFDAVIERRCQVTGIFKGSRICCFIGLKFIPLLAGNLTRAAADAAGGIDEKPFTGSLVNSIGHDLPLSRDSDHKSFGLGNHRVSVARSGGQQISGVSHSGGVPAKAPGETDFMNDTVTYFERLHTWGNHCNCFYLATG